MLIHGVQLFQEMAFKNINSFKIYIFSIETKKSQTVQGSQKLERDGLMHFWFVYKKEPTE